MRILLACILIPCICHGAPDTDIRSVPEDIVIPALSNTEPGPGIRVRQTHPDYVKTQVHHIINLPTNWVSGKTYPVIVEYTGNGGYRNEYGDTCTGKVEDAVIGYGISEGKDFIWVVLPYLDEKGENNVTKWWGSSPDYKPHSTIQYAKKTIPWICKEYGGNPGRVILTGFSRGSIACNYIGLNDDEIASLWSAFICYSHYDGVITRWPYPEADRASAIARLKRLDNRPQYIISEQGIDKTRKFIESSEIEGDFTYAETGFRNHNDAWILRPSPAREKLRDWLYQKLNM